MAQDNQKCSPYGFGENPPYSLYMTENGKWGLVDKDGVRLPAIFERDGDNCFSSSINEVVSFDEKAGFLFVAGLIRRKYFPLIRK